ncbi:hypothetical protein HII31_13569 [Pseudocercospora fuligena]|uniref:Uncharacterized protein n=1 Tax=Pseudocercospora fuligena TaxID=685502 RepID=A0A8H6R5F3_9PEZI|nr:hypothetical protein HII31_13569 [Pseudocercospora fuligena]
MPHVLDIPVPIGGREESKHIYSCMTWRHDHSPHQSHCFANQNKYERTVLRTDHFRSSRTMVSIKIFFVATLLALTEAVPKKKPHHNKHTEVLKDSKDQEVGQGGKCPEKGIVPSDFKCDNDNYPYCCYAKVNFIINTCVVGCNSKSDCSGNTEPNHGEMCSSD